MRNTQLDALRAIAVLLVLGNHFQINFTWFRIGWTGVELFFVLSGFLIAGILFREIQATGELQIGRFLLRRGLKIYPAYYGLLFGTILYDVITRGPLPLPKEIFADLFFVQSYTAGVWPHLWSVAVEEHFYVALPIVLALLVKLRKLHAVPFVCAAVILVCNAMRVGRFLMHAPFTFYTAQTPTHLRIDSIAFGVLIAYCFEFRPRVIEALLPWRGRALLMVSPASLCCVWAKYVNETEHPMIDTIGFALLYMGFGGMLIYALKIVRPGLIVRSLARIGPYSYTMYLLHVPVTSAVNAMGLRADVRGVFVYFFGTAFAGITAAKLIEQPVLRIRERLYPAALSVKIRQRSATPREAVVPVA